MSYAWEVKTELCRTPPSRKCCARAEAYGVLLYCNTFQHEQIKIVTEHEGFYRRLPQLFKKGFKLALSTGADGPEEGKRTLTITDPQALSVITEAFGLEREALSHHINFAVLEEACCRAAFLRGAFLAGGSVTDPKKGYHLELATTHFSVGREMPALMHESGFSPKMTTRKGNSIVYFKRSNTIEDFLTTIGAPVSAMGIMTAKLEKNLRGSVNRRVNCDAANLDKVVEAAQIQIEAIRRLEAAGRLAELPDKLRQTAQLRLEHPEDTLTQLAEQTLPPVSKSALNHRLRKLVDMAK